MFNAYFPGLAQNYNKFSFPSAEFLNKDQYLFIEAQ